MTSFDLNNVNTFSSQPVQSIGYTKNIPIIRDKVEIPLPKENSYISEGQMVNILREKGIDATKRRIEIAMALYYQNQAIHEDNIKYMEQMAEILKLNSQEAYEAYILLVTNALEVTDERISSVKEIITNKNFVNDLKDLKTTIEELDQIIVQGVEEKEFIEVQDIETVIDTTIKTTQETNVYKANADTSKSIVIDEVINENVTQNVIENEVLSQDKFQTQINQKSIDNTLTNIAQSIKQTEEIGQDFQENIIIDNKSNNIKNTLDVIKPQESTIIKNDINQKQTFAEKVVSEQYIPKDLNTYNVDLKKITQQINTLLSLKKEIFSLSNSDISSSNTPSKSEYIGTAKFSQPQSFFDGIQTFEGGLRNFGMSDDAKSIYQESNNQDEPIIFKKIDNEVYVEVKNDNGVPNKTYRIYSDIKNLKDNVPFIALINGIPKLIEKSKTDIKILQVNLNITDDILNTMSPKQLKTVIIDGKPNLFIIDNKQEKQITQVNNSKTPESRLSLENSSKTQKPIQILDTEYISDYKPVNSSFNENVKNNIIFNNKPNYQIQTINNRNYLVISESSSLAKVNVITTNSKEDLGKENILFNNNQGLNDISLKKPESKVITQNLNNNDNKLFLEISDKIIKDLTNTSNFKIPESFINNIDKSNLKIAVKDGISYLSINNKSQSFDVPISDILLNINIPEIKLNDILKDSKIINKITNYDSNTNISDPRIDFTQPIIINSTSNIKNLKALDIDKIGLMNNQDSKVVDNKVSNNIIKPDVELTNNQDSNIIDNKSLNNVIKPDVRLANNQDSNIIDNKSLNNVNESKIINKPETENQVFKVSGFLNPDSKIIIKTDSGFKVFELNPELKQQVKDNNITSIKFDETNNNKIETKLTIPPQINKASELSNNKENISNNLSVDLKISPQSTFNPNKIVFIDNNNQIIIIPENIVNNGFVDITNEFFNIPNSINESNISDNVNPVIDNKSINISDDVNPVIDNKSTSIIDKNITLTNNSVSKDIKVSNIDSNSKNVNVIDNSKSNEKNINIDSKQDFKSITNTNKTIEFNGKNYLITNDNLIDIDSTNTINNSIINQKTSSNNEKNITISYINDKPVIEVKNKSNISLIIPIHEANQLRNLISNQTPIILNSKSLDIDNKTSNNVIKPEIGLINNQGSKVVDNKVSNNIIKPDVELTNNQDSTIVDNKSLNNVIKPDVRLANNQDSNIIDNKSLNNVNESKIINKPETENQVFKVSGFLNPDSKIIIKTDSGFKVFELNPELKQQVKDNNITGIKFDETNNNKIETKLTIPPQINKASELSNNKENISNNLSVDLKISPQSTFNPNKIVFIDNNNQIIIIPENIVNNGFVDITNEFFNIPNSINESNISDDVNPVIDNKSINVSDDVNPVIDNKSTSIIDKNITLTNNSISKDIKVSNIDSISKNVNVIDNSKSNEKNINIDSKQDFKSITNTNKTIEFNGKNYLIINTNNSIIQENRTPNLFPESIDSVSNNSNNSVLNDTNNTSENLDNNLTSLFALPLEEIENAPNTINQIKKEVFNFEYSQIKQNLNNNIKNIVSTESNNIPIVINGIPVIINKSQNQMNTKNDVLQPEIINNSTPIIKTGSNTNMDKSINNVNIIPLKDGEEIPSYLEAKIGKDDFVFIRLEDNKNIFIPKLKVENSILEDINSLLEITSLETLDNNIDDNKPTQFLNNQVNKIDLGNNKSNINNNSIQQNITQSTNDRPVDSSEKIFVKGLDNNSYLIPKSRQDFKAIPTNQPIILAFDKNNEAVLITNDKLIEHPIIIEKENLDEKGIIIPKNVINNQLKESKLQNISNIGLIDLNNNINLSQGLKTELFQKPITINNLKNESNQVKQFIFSDDNEIYSFSLNNKSENLVINNDINKSFNKTNISIFNDQIITKQDNRVFRTEITPELLKNSEPITKGFNLTKENGIIIFNNDGVKQLNIDDISQTISLEEEPIFFRIDSSNKNIINSLNNNQIKNINNFSNKDFILIKNPEDLSLRLINQDSLSDFGQEKEFNGPININSVDRKGIIFKSPINSDLKFITTNNIVQNSEKIITSVILKVNNQDNLLIPDKDGMKLFNISNNSNQADIVNDKLKVKIDGKVFFIIPENKTGEHLIVPENPTLSKNKIDLSSPLKVQIGKEDFVLFNNNQNNKLQIIPETKANKLSSPIQQPISTNINGSEFLFSNVDKKVYKLPLNNKVIENSKLINEPIQLTNLNFLVFDKNNKPNIANLDPKQLFKADKITENIILNNEAGEFLIIPSKNSKIIPMGSIDKISKFTTDIKTNNVLINNDNGTFILNKNHLDKNKVEINEPILLKNNDKEFVFISGKKNSGFVPKETIVKNSSVLENVFIPDKNISNFIFKDNTGNIKNISIPNNLIKNPEKIKEPLQTKIENQNLVIVPDKENINIINLKPEDKIDNSKNYKITVNNKNFNLFFDNDKAKIVNENVINKLENHDFSKPFKINIDNSEYIIFKSPDDNKIKILPTDKISINNVENFDIENINEFDVSEFVNDSINNKNESKSPITTNKVINEPNSINSKDYKISLSISDGELVLRKVTKQSQNDINIENIKNLPIEELSDNKGIDAHEIANNGLLINQVANNSKSVKENDKVTNIQDNQETVDSNSEVNTISSSPSKTSKADLSKYDVKISFDSLINSVLSGKNNDKSAIEGIKGLNLFLHKDDEIIETDEQSKEPLIFNIKEQKKEKFVPQEKFTLAQNTAGKESLIIKSADNSLKAINIDKKGFSDFEEPIIDDNGDIILPDKESNSLFRLNNKSINNIVPKNINQSVFVQSNTIITKQINNFIETPINNVINHEIEENNPFIAKIEGKENIIISHKGNLKQIPVNYLSGNIEKLKENSIFSQDNHKFLFLKDNKSNILVNIDKNTNFKDIGNLSNIRIDNQPFIVKNNKLVLDDSKNNNVTTNIKEISLNKPIKIDTNIGTGIVFIDPATNKIKFIDNKQISENNLLKETDNINISPNNYVLTRKNDLVRFKLQDNVLNKANELNNPKEILVNDEEQIIIPNNSNKMNYKISSKSMIINKKEILDSSKIIDRPFYINHDDEKYLFLNSKNGFKSLRTNDLINKLEKIEQPIIFEKNNNIHIIKNDLSSIRFDKSIIEDEIDNTDLEQNNLIPNKDVNKSVNTNKVINSNNDIIDSKNLNLNTNSKPNFKNLNNISNVEKNHFLNESLPELENITKEPNENKQINNFISKPIKFNNTDEKIKPNTINTNLNNFDSINQDIEVDNTPKLEIKGINTYNKILNQPNDKNKSYIDKNTLFFKDNSYDFIVEIIPQKNFIKDSNKLSNISINGDSYKISNNKLMPLDKINNVIDINKPIKISSNLGEGLIYSDPINGKTKFISTLDLKNNNINNLIDNISKKDNINPKDYILSKPISNHTNLEENILTDLDRNNTINNPSQKNKSNVVDTNVLLNNFDSINQDIEADNTPKLEIKGMNNSNKIVNQPNDKNKSYIDKNTLFFKDNSHDFIVEIIPQKNFIKDSNKLSNISINGDSYKISNNKLMPLDKSNNVIDINKPIKISSNLGEGLIYSDPINGKTKFISTLDLKNNNSTHTLENIDKDQIYKDNVQDNHFNIQNTTKIEGKENTKFLNTNNNIKLDNSLNNTENKNYNKDLISETKSFEQNILFNNSIVSQISSQENSTNKTDSLDTVQKINYEQSDSIVSKTNISEKSNNLDNKSTEKMSFDSLINSVLSGKDEHKKAVEGIKELNFFAKQGDENERKEPLKDDINEFTPMITYGKDKKVLIKENGELKYVDINDKTLAKKANKPILINHQGKNKILAVKEQLFMVNIEKINTDKLYSEINEKNIKINESNNKPSIKNNITTLTIPQVENIKNDISKTKEIIDNIVNNDILHTNNNEMSAQINKISMMYGALENQVKILKSELKEFKKSDNEEGNDSGILESLLSVSKSNTNKNSNIRKNNNDKLPFETLLKSVLSEAYSKVEKINLNLQGREILSNNEKCFCIPISIPIGELRFNGEIMVRQELDSRNRNKGKRTLNITLCVQTKTLSTVLIDITNLDRDLQVSLKVENQEIKKIFDDKLEKINKILKNSSYVVKPVTCSINKNTGRGNSLLIPKDSFPKSLKRIDGVI